MIGFKRTFSFTFFVLAVLSLGCQQSPNTTSGRYWSIVMTTANTARITFGLPLSSTGTGVLSGGMNSNFATSPYNLTIATGATTGDGNTACQMIGPGGSVIVAPGAQTGTIMFAGGCSGNVTTNLGIALGNISTGLKDTNNDYIVSPGRSAICTIIPPGASTGAGTCTVGY